ncbi:MAG: hypothetical protein GY856_14985, partial [bacterium]|nr:hypothetical protein [bacterium]
MRGSVHELFATQAESTRDAVAPVGYRELNRRADQLARRLPSEGIGGLCVEHDRRVPVGGVERSPAEGTREWMAEHRHEELKPHGFATKYLVDFSPLPAFRELVPEAYPEKVPALVREIEDKGAPDRGHRPLF